MTERPDWERFTRPEFGVEFSYPAVTARGQAVERRDEPFREYPRVHLSSPDKQELYFELVRFDGLSPQDEYQQHRPFLEQRFGAEAITALTETKLRESPVWTYGFRWNEGDRPKERSVLLLQVGDDTYRVIFDPRSALNAQVLATLAITP